MPGQLVDAKGKQIDDLDDLSLQKSLQDNFLSADIDRYGGEYL
jgi:hypothetical protein